MRDQNALEEFETLSVTMKADSPLPAGRYSPSHYRVVHRHLFGQVYPWAGRYRTVRISKGQSAFCYPEHIPASMTELFSGLRADHGLRGLDESAFARDAAAFLAALNAIHPFREGNGRTQMTFASMIAATAGHPFDLARLDAQAFLDAMKRSFFGDEAPLARQLRDLIVR